MIIRSGKDIPSSEITPEGVYRRRGFLRRMAQGAGIVAASGLLPGALYGCARDADDAKRVPEDVARGFGMNESGGSIDQQPGQPWKRALQADDTLTPWDDVTTYNNFYEFGTDKSDPAENATKFRTSPWTVAVEGLVKKPANYHLEDFIKPYAMEDRVYRHRCVEAWSMIIPWHGFPMADFIRKVEPLPSAKYVEFTTLLDPQQMPGQRTGVLDWPYVEGLRLDEAMHPLTLFATGVYGKALPNQNGAPLRTVMPWKYGFKATKSIVKVRFTDRQPRTTWNMAAPNEYGFFANVNPEVDHPRWTQAKERRIGEWRRRQTLMFNGYADQVASLYSGMDLRKYY